MTKKDRKVILFPGTYTRLIEEAEQHAAQYKFQQAVQLFDEAFTYHSFDTVRDNIIYTYVYCLHEIKEHARAKEVCDYVLNRQVRSMFYFEFVELYVSICIDLRDYALARQVIDDVLQEGFVPQQQIEQFEHLRALNDKLANKRKEKEELVEEVVRDEQYLDAALFLQQPPNMQLFQLQQLMATNIRPYSLQLKGIIENADTHVFVKSIALLLLVEQQVDIDVQVEKFEQTTIVNPAQLQLPTKLPQFTKVHEIVVERTERDPSIYAMIEQLIAKHSIVTYPFEWLHFDAEDVALSYIDYVHTMFGDIREMDYEIVEFLQMLEHLTELPQ